jgi:hypothetical protein
VLNATNYFSFYGFIRIFVVTAKLSDYQRITHGCKKGQMKKNGPT